MTQITSCLGSRVTLRSSLQVLGNSNCPTTREDPPRRRFIEATSTSSPGAVRLTEGSLNDNSRYDDSNQVSRRLVFQRALVTVTRVHSSKSLGTLLLNYGKAMVVH